MITSKDILNKIGTDKIIHFLCSVILAILLTKWTGTIIYAGILAFLIGILKEVYDLKATGFFEIRDILANTLGIITGIILWII